MIDDLWYKNGVFYCLSVGTYMDANGDGVGDFKGLLRRLDYLHGLGVTAIWLMPFQPSPGKDDGYDISDYYGVDPRYGTLGDFVEFTHGCQQRGIRVIIDLVVNHTSDAASLVSRRAQLEGFAISRLVCLVRQEAGQCQHRHGVSRRAEIDLDPRQGSRRLVLPSLLRFPARSQHFEPACAGRDPQDHGVLDSARRLRLSHGRGAVRDRDQGRQGAKARRAIRHAALVPRIPAMAAGQRHHPRRSQCAAGNRHGIFRPRRRPHAHDVQFSRQPASVLRAGFRRLRARWPNR